MSRGGRKKGGGRGDGLAWGRKFVWHTWVGRCSEIKKMLLSYYQYYVIPNTIINE